jgi:predicted 3-demethylubiquinone-9 3-methyltransferase (glyoxalase superfamily)
MTVSFRIRGQDFVGLNGGPQFKFDEAVSFQIFCDTQEEVDRYWEKLGADGGQPGPCGWIKDRFGLSWQVVPNRLMELVKDSDRQKAGRAMDAMLKMGKIDIAALERAAAG